VSTAGKPAIEGPYRIVHQHHVVELGGDPRQAACDGLLTVFPALDQRDLLPQSFFLQAGLEGCGVVGTQRQHDLADLRHRFELAQRMDEHGHAADLDELLGSRGHAGWLGPCGQSAHARPQPGRRNDDKHLHRAGKYTVSGFRFRVSR